MKIPYGVADFYSLRTEGQLYVDRTDRITVVEELGKSLLFLRPRRFGKSLWLSTLASYYDLRRADAACISSASERCSCRWGPRAPPPTISSSLS